MRDVILIPLLLQLVVPAAMLAVLAVVSFRTLAGAVLSTVAATVYMATLWMVGLWLALPWYMPVVYGVILFVLMLRLVRVHLGGTARQRGKRAWTEILLTSVACLVVILVFMQALEGRRPPATAVDLSFPLKNGQYLVLNGGSNSFTNPHLATLSAEPRYRPYRGQSYGVDVTKLNTFGFRARGLLPAEPRDYKIFGDSVIAPCAGEVIQAVDGLRDLSPPRSDREHMAGNHVLMRCGERWILIGHLQRGTVAVANGQPLQVGDFLGAVGNSGNTNEPHLHIHAQTPGTSSMPLGGEPLHLRFEGTFPRRNDRIVAK
jgi:hypothetical protein